MNGYYSTTYKTLKGSFFCTVTERLTGKVIKELANYPTQAEAETAAREIISELVKRDEENERAYAESLPGRAPGFEKTYGRKPIAGKDYDPDSLCQDDYEYLTGTGRYF